MKKSKAKKAKDRDKRDTIEAPVAEPGEETTQAEETAVDKCEAGRDSVEDLQAKIESLEDRLLRAKADFQNFQRRSAIERSEAIRYANTELMRSLLGVLDDFERSLAAAESSDNTASVVDGVRLVYENLVKALRQHGLETIEALRQPFDPHFHQAVMQQASEDHPAGTVLQETARGYRLRDRVIRPTKVIVSQSPDANKPGESDTRDGEAAQDESARKEGEPG